MDEDTIDPPAPPAKRKVGRPRKPKAVAKPSPYEGISAMKCADACRPERCVISHTDYCAKGSLQAAHMGDAAAVRRFKEARAFMAHAAVDKKAKR